MLVAYHLVHNLGAALIVWLYKPLPVDAPGRYGAVVMIPIAATALWSALRTRERAPAASSAPAHGAD